MSDKDWTAEKPWHLMDYIVATHHAYLNRQLPLIAQLLTEQTRDHWLRHPEMLGAHSAFYEVWAALQQHLFREETTAVPMLHARERDSSTSMELFQANIDGHIEEHADALAGLAKVRAILWDFKRPEDVGEEMDYTFRLLTELTHDLETHIHLEDDILFDQVRALD